jgi:DNA-binding response OmpR family regulator
VNVGSLAVDTEARVATLGGEALSLTATEYRLLEHLARHAGKVLSREQLAEHVWGAEYDPFSNVSDVYVGYLRRKLDREGNPPRIHTIRGLGYVLKEGDAE